MKVSIDRLNALGRTAIERSGYTGSEAETILDVLMYAQLRGNNQGLVKLIGPGIPKSPEARPIEVVRDTPMSAVIDGHQQMAMLVLVRAVEMAVAKAADHGFGIVGTNNTSTSTGAIGYYAARIARAGLLGFVFAGSPETVNAHGSYEPIFGTNPLAIGVPASGEPIVLDMATAAIPYYGLIEAKTAGRKIPEGIAYDRDGRLTTDPAAAMDGAIRPFDRGHKGAGLALMVEVLTGPLVGAAFAGIGDSARNWGNLVLAIDPGLLTDRSVFAENVARLAGKVKGTKRLPGVSEVFLPGERGTRLAREQLSAGTIEIEERLLGELKKAAGEE